VKARRLSVKHEGYGFLLVLELADRSLSTTLIHDHIAGTDFFLIRKIASDLAKALDHLHEHGRIHADLKPLNAVRIASSWQLIDLDVSCAVGATFGEKVPSSGYCPPEMAKVLLDATDDKTGKVDTTKLSAYVANVAYDLWSFGVVLFHLVTGRPLWLNDQNDNVSPVDLHTLAHWKPGDLERQLKNAVRNASPEQQAAFDLIRKLLEPSATARCGNFVEGCEMQSVLDHTFFRARGLDDATLVKMSKQLKESNELLQTMDAKLDKVLDGLAAHFQMLSTLLHGADKLAPKLICFLPTDAFDGAKEGSSKTVNKRWWRTALTPRCWLNERVRLFFFDPIHLTLAPTNPDDEGVGQGFEITFPRDWVAKAMPYVQLGLATLRVAAMAGRLTGFPVPDVAGVVGGRIDEQLRDLNSIKGDAFDWLGKQTANPALATQLLNQVDEHVQGVLAGKLEEAIPVEGDAFTEQLKQPLEKSVAELDALLPSGWKDKCGLVLATAQDGRSEYVLEADKADFECKGAAMIGDKSRLLISKESEAEAEARKTALEQLEQQQQQKQHVVRVRSPADTTGVLDKPSFQGLDEATLQEIKEMIKRTKRIEEKLMNQAEQTKAHSNKAGKSTSKLLQMMSSLKRMGSSSGKGGGSTEVGDGSKGAAALNARL